MSEMDFDSICERFGIPEGMRKHVAADAPARGKLAVARGMLPMPPKVLLSMMYLLVGDADSKVAGAAEEGITAMPAERMVPLLDSETHPKILEFLAYRRGADERLMEKVVLLRQINDKTICYLAETGSERIAEMIGNNQERLVVSPTIVRFLRRNPRATKSLVERVQTFQRLIGVDVGEATEEEKRQSEELQRQRASAAAGSPSSAALPPPPPAAVAPTQPEPLPTVVPAAAVGALEADPIGALDLAPSVVPPLLRDEANLPADFLPGEVYIPATAAAGFVPFHGLLNPLGALFADWGIPEDRSYLAPPYLHAGTASTLDAQAVPAAVLPSGPLFEAPTAAPSAIVAPTRSAVDVVDTTGLSSIADSDFAFGFDESGDDFGTEFTEDRDITDEGEKLTLQQAIAKMSTGQKIKLAYKGNKTVRELLIRDTNKIVACAVVKGGRLTDNEALSVASNRAIHEDVIRLLADNKEFLRKYPVKLALAGNPKTPIPVAMGLLSSIHLSDLKILSNNRNISSAVFGAAGKMVKARQH